MDELAEITVVPANSPVPESVQRLIEEGLRRGKSVHCFDWVPSNYRAVYETLAAMPKGRFCEWGSGMGIVTGMAEILGNSALGIELEPQLVEASRKLLADFGISATINQGSYLEIPSEADVYFVYCWPGKIYEVKERFLATAPSAAKILIYEGEQHIHCFEKKIIDALFEKDIC